MRRSIGMASDRAAFSYQSVDLRSSDLFTILRLLLLGLTARDLGDFFTTRFDAECFTDATPLIPTLDVILANGARVPGALSASKQVCEFASTVRREPAAGAPSRRWIMNATDFGDK